MDSPVFKLEQVVHNREGMEDFEGPLDLILFLLSKNKIEIQDIPIALILDQYLAYLEMRQQMDLEVASEFITMAAQLMFIKTRMLLSIEDEELGPMGEFGRNIMVRGPEPVERGKIYLYDHQPEDLIAAMQEIADRDQRRAPPPLTNFAEIVSQEPYPVASKAGEILERLKNIGITSFRLLFRGSRSRSEVVATFIAVLELCKARMIRLAGSETDCTVTPTGEGGDTLTL